MGFSKRLSALLAGACCMQACVAKDRAQPPRSAPEPQAASLPAPAAASSKAPPIIRAADPPSGQAILEVSVLGQHQNHGPFAVTVNGVDVGHAPVLLRVLPGDYDVVAVSRGDRHYCPLELRASVVLQSGIHRHLVFEPQGPRIAADPDAPLRGMGEGLKHLRVKSGEAPGAERQAAALPPRCR